MYYVVVLDNLLPLMLNLSSEQLVELEMLDLEIQTRELEIFFRVLVTRPGIPSNSSTF